MLGANAQCFGNKRSVGCVVWVILFGHICVPQNVKSSKLHHLAHLGVVQLFVVTWRHAVVDVVVVGGVVHRANYHVGLKRAQKCQLLWVVVGTAHFKPKQQLDLPIVLFGKRVKLLLALLEGETAKCVDVATLDVVGKAQNVNPLLDGGKYVFLHCVVGGIVVTVVCVNVQIAPKMCFHATSLARNTPFVNDQNRQRYIRFVVGNLAETHFD